MAFGFILFVACSRHLNTSPVVRSTVHQSPVVDVWLDIVCCLLPTSQYFASCEVNCTPVVDVWLDIVRCFPPTYQYFASCEVNCTPVVDVWLYIVLLLSPNVSILRQIVEFFYFVIRACRCWCIHLDYCNVEWFSLYLHHDYSV